MKTPTAINLGIRGGRLGSAALAVVFSLTIAACSHQTSAPEGGGPSFDWSNPLPDGEAVSLSQAQSDQGLTVIFAPRLSSSYTPNLIEEDKASSIQEADHRQLAMAYSTPGTGQFVVFETVIDANAAQAEFTNLTAQVPGCVTLSPNPGIGPEPAVECKYGSGHFDILNDGTRALLFQNATGIGLFWTVPLSPNEAAKVTNPDITTPALEIQVQGQVPSMSEAQVLKIGNSF